MLIVRVLVSASSRTISMGGVKDVSYSKTEYNDDQTRANLVVTIHYKKENASVRRENVSLIKTDKGWKVSL